MTTINKDLSKAIEMVAYKLLYTEFYDTQEMKSTQCVMDSEKTPEEAIRKAIGCGRGGSFEGCGEYWMYWCTQGPKVEIASENGNSVDVSAAKFMAVVRSIWDKEKNNQLQLF